MRKRKINGCVLTAALAFSLIAGSFVSAGGSLVLAAEGSVDSEDAAAAVPASVETLSYEDSIAELEAVVAQAESLDGDSYTEESWDALQETLAGAETLLDEEEASAEEVDTETLAVMISILSLTEDEEEEEEDSAADKSALSSLITSAQALSTDGYSDASIAAFEAALAAAQAVIDDADATQDAVDAQILLLKAAAAALVEAEESDVVYDGTYEITGELWNATNPTKNSMGNAAFSNPMEIIVSTDADSGETSVTLRVTMVSMDYTLGSTTYTGYLATLKYFPGITAYSELKTAESVDATVEEYYEDVYDSYNDPDTGTDENIKGQLYPKVMTMAWDALGQEQMYVQVYVPIMEEILSGGGTQYAILELDWDTLTQISGTDADTDELESLIETAEFIEQGTASDETYAALTAMLASAKEVAASLNYSQTAVDSVAAALSAAIAAVSSEDFTAEKTELGELLAEAETCMTRTDVTYTEDTLAALTSAYESALSVYQNEEASQTAVENAVSALSSAIEALETTGAVKTSLLEELEEAADLIEEMSSSDSYSSSALALLQDAYAAALAVYNSTDADQDDVDAQTRVLAYLLSSLTAESSTDSAKSGLHDLIVTASNLAGQSGVYTSDSISALLTVIAAAEAVYDDDDATSDAITEQCNALVSAMRALEVSDSSSTSDDSSDGDADSDSDSDDDSSSSSSSDLDIDNLEDGIYKLTGYMVKVDKETYSMSNNAINHTIRLTVEDGVYYITMDFKGLSISGSYGYLSELKYFLTGYTTDSYGNPQGDLADVTVESYQTDDDGTLVSDSYGTNYPDVVTFELIPEALEDGYVPLQVFVPIMEAIADGTGTQPVYLSLLWSSIEATTADDSDFTSDDDDSDDDDDDSDSTSSLSLNTLGTSTLSSSSSLGSSSLDSSDLSSSLSSSSISTGDDSPAEIWTAVLASCAAAAVIVLLERRKVCREKR